MNPWKYTSPWEEKMDYSCYCTKWMESVNRHTLMSAPPARLWSSSTEAIGVSLAWVSASPKVIPSLFLSPKVVSSGVRLASSAEEVSVCPEDVGKVETWILFLKCYQLSQEIKLIVLPLHNRDNIQKHFKIRTSNSNLIVLHSSDYNADHLCQHCLWCRLVYRALATHPNFKLWVLSIRYIFLTLNKFKRLPVKRNIIAYSNNSKQRLPMNCKE